VPQVAIVNVVVVYVVVVNVVVAMNSVGAVVALIDTPLLENLFSPYCQINYSKTP
jgi:hypothetical protein